MEAELPKTAFPAGGWDAPETGRARPSAWDLQTQPAAAVGYAPAPRAIQTTSANVGVPKGNPFSRPSGPRPQGVSMIQRLRKAFEEMPK